MPAIDEPHLAHHLTLSDALQRYLGALDPRVKDEHRAAREEVHSVRWIARGEDHRLAFILALLERTRERDQRSLGESLYSRKAPPELQEINHLPILQYTRCVVLALAVAAK